MYYSTYRVCDMLNGEGLRTVLFVSGCSHNCKGCHNPETHNPCYGKHFTQDTLREIVKSLEEPWCSGLTLSGGDPLYIQNREEVLHIVETVRETFGQTKNIWLYTGYTLEELKDLNDESINKILKSINVLVDGRFVLEKKKLGLQWCGSDNQRIIRF